MSSDSTEHRDTRVSLNDDQFCYVRLLDQSQYTFVDPNPEINCNRLGHHGDRVSEGIQIFEFALLIEPSAEEIDKLLVLAGFTEASDLFTLSDNSDLTSFTTHIDRSAANQIYAGTKVDKMIFRGQQGRHPISCELHCKALSMTEGTYSGTPITNRGAPYAFSAGSLALPTAYRFNSWVQVLDNHLAARWNDEVTASALANVERTVHMGINTPYTTSEKALLTTAIGASRLTGLTGTVTFSATPRSTTFEYFDLKWEANPPDLPGKPHEVRMPIWFKAYETDDNHEVEVTNVLAP